MFGRRLYDWLTLADYEAAKADATERIVKRLSRGNVSAQNAWYMTEDDLVNLSIAADAALRKMQRRMHDKFA